MTEKKENREQIQKKICDCAAGLFQLYGYDQVSMRQIASEMGMAVGNLTYYFSKKEDLMRELLSEFQREFEKITETLQLDILQQSIAGKAYWEYENRTLVAVLLWFIREWGIFCQHAKVIYDNYRCLQKKIPAFFELSRSWDQNISTIYKELIRQLWERRVLRRDLEWEEYENLIQVLLFIMNFWPETEGEKKAQDKAAERICRLFLPYVSLEWKETYVSLCRTICEVTFHSKTLKFIS